MLCAFLINVAKLPSAKTVGVHVVAVGEGVSFPACQPVLSILLSFNFADLMGEMVFAFENIHVSPIIS